MIIDLIIVIKYLDLKYLEANLVISKHISYYFEDLDNRIKWSNNFHYIQAQLDFNSKEPEENCQTYM